MGRPGQPAPRWSRRPPLPSSQNSTSSGHRPPKRGRASTAAPQWSKAPPCSQCAGAPPRDSPPRSGWRPSTREQASDDDWATDQVPVTPEETRRATTPRPIPEHNILKPLEAPKNIGQAQIILGTWDAQHRRPPPQKYCPCQISCALPDFFVLCQKKIVQVRQVRAPKKCAEYCAWPIFQARD